MMINFHFPFLSLLGAVIFTLFYNNSKDFWKPLLIGRSIHDFFVILPLCLFLVWLIVTKYPHLRFQGISSLSLRHFLFFAIWYLDIPCFLQQYNILIFVTSITDTYFTGMTILVTRWVSYIKHELLTIREHLCTLLDSFIVGPMLFIFLVSHVLFLLCLSSFCIQCCLCFWIANFWLPFGFL